MILLRHCCKRQDRPDDGRDDKEGPRTSTDSVTVGSWRRQEDHKVVNNQQLDLVQIPGGSYRMGKGGHSMWIIYNRKR